MNVSVTEPTPINKLNPKFEACLGFAHKLIFIDADKVNYLNYYRRSLDLLAPNGLILIDNVLWSGRVADPQVQDANTKAIRALNEKIRTDSRVDTVLVPIADGFALPYDVDVNVK